MVEKRGEKRVPFYYNYGSSRNQGISYLGISKSELPVEMRKVNVG